MTSVALIGVGAMGAPMARRLLAAGFDLTLYDPRQEAVGTFRGTQARLAGAPQACAEADVVLIVVATGDQVRDVITRPGGLASGLTATISPLVVVMSTIGRQSILDVHGLLAPAGIRMIEAPISGGAARAEEGTLSVLLGGELKDIETARPVLERLGSNLFHCGPLGTAQVVKISNNVLGNLNTMATAEVYRLILENGLDLPAATRVFEASSGRNWLSATPGLASGAYAALTATPFEATTAIMRKDTALATELAAASPGAYPVITTLASLITALDDDTFQNWRVIADAQEQP